MAETCLLAMWCPVHRWRDSMPGSGTELENLPAVLREKAQAEAREAESTDPLGRGALSRSSREAG